MNSAFAGYIAAAIGVPLAFIVLRKLFPSIAASKASGPSSVLLAKRFFKWDAFAVCIFILLAGATGYIWWLVFSKMELLNAIRFKHAAITVPPSGYVWGFPAIIAGIGSGMYLADKALRAMLKNRYSEYVSYQNQKYRIKGQKLEIPIYITLTCITLIMLFMLSNWYTLFFYDHVIVKRLFAFSEDKLKYTDVYQIDTAPSLTAPNGDVVNRKEYLIRFSSGTSWTTNLAPTDLTLNQKHRIAQFVSHASGVPITEVKRFTKNDLY